ncbi:MAG: T9SS type A sorting domain-containing protein, partial [candidate division Zixibacteria bacterium]|nr:T9SS type A sorting domain-containing protein [candidate division Zixibacteria bacterium]
RQQVKSALARGEWQYNQVTAIESDEDNILPALFTLSQNFPNPFNSGTVIEFSLPRSGDYRFAVYNMLGQLVDYRQVTGATAGRQVITWQGTDRNKQPVASGVYFYRITFGGNSQIRKMVLLK